MTLSLTGRVTGFLVSGVYTSRQLLPKILPSFRQQSSICQTVTLTSCRKNIEATTLSNRVSLAGCFTSSLLKVCMPFVNSIRTAVRYSIRRGKPKTVKAVTARFYRLPWGIYIRTRAGRHKHKWKKPDWINERSKYHVFCNKQQSRMLDKMTTQQWKKYRHYVDDCYAPYMKRTGIAGDFSPPKFLP